MLLLLHNNCPKPARLLCTPLTGRMSYAAAIMLGMFVFFVPFLDLDAHALHNHFDLTDHITYDYDVYPILNFKSNEITFALDRDVWLQSIDVAKIDVGMDRDSISLEGTSVVGADMEYGRYVTIKLTDEIAAILASASGYQKLDLAPYVVYDDRYIENKRTMYVIHAVGTYVDPNIPGSADTAENSVVPVIVLNGSPSLEVARGSMYYDAGAVCSDGTDPYRKTILSVLNNVDTTTADTYKVTYICTDMQGNVATLTRMVTVADRLDETSHIPASLTAVTITSDSIAVAWPPFAGATSYNLEWRSVYSPNITDYLPTVYAPVDGLGYTITGLKPDRLYTIDVTGNPYNKLGAPLIVRTLPAETLPDTTAPAITLTGSSPVTINVDDAYADAGATCTDDTDGSISPTFASTVDTSAPGNYTVTYSCTDSAGNSAAEVIRIITILDTPVDNLDTDTYAVNTTLVATVKGYAAETHHGQEHVDRWNRVLAAFGVMSHANPMTAAAAQEYADKYSAARWNPVVDALTALGEQQPLHVPDTVAPTITLTDSSPVTINVGDTYTDAGATCTDDTDTNPTLTTDNPVDANTPGNYTVTYSCIDSAGNSATLAYRTVDVRTPPDTTAPTITLAGSPSVALATGDTYTDAGATCTDDTDTNPTLTTDNPVDANTPGNYTVTYSCIDSAGNSATLAYRTVDVRTPPDTTAPTITLAGSPSVALVTGDTYTDAGATCTDDTDTNPTLTTDNPVDANTPGNYTVTYSCIDSAGNSATLAYRTVTVSEPSSYAVDLELIAAVRGYASETHHGPDHVDRWNRVLAAFGVAQHDSIMTAQEAQTYAYKFNPERWNPVIEAMEALQGTVVDKPAALIAAVQDYAAEDAVGSKHVERWNRVLAALGAGTHANPMTAAEAKTYVDNGWKRWIPVVDSLTVLEAQQ